MKWKPTLGIIIAVGVVVVGFVMAPDDAQIARGAETTSRQCGDNEMVVGNSSGVHCAPTMSADVKRPMVYGPGFVVGGTDGTLKTQTANLVPLVASSPDGTISTAPSGGTLNTAAGTWTWGAAASGRPGEYYTVLNGSTPGNGIASLMEVAGGGMLYAQTADGQWFLWQNNGFIKTTAPPPPSAPSTPLMTQGATWLAAHDMKNIPFGWFPTPSTIWVVNCTIQNPVGGAATFSIVKAPKGTPLSQSTTIISKPCDGNQASGSNQDLTQGLIAVNAGDTVGIVSTSSTWVTGAGVGQVAVGYTVP